ncbi:hypothetical protein [Calidifontibacillus oryziterrae]|uniref:hypothetical protein n=1 Tax=Calidifontibacillus oryziterrae TaxID=1191699 RepID=UPI0002DB6A09|nr:hypothetical protein [Calidifontibacillus oryziterrae]
MSEEKQDQSKLNIKEHGLTYDDYAANDDGNRYELANGQLDLMNPVPTVLM